MKNFLEYFYNINIDNIKQESNYYFFTYKSVLYKLYINEYIPNPNLVQSICEELKNILPISEIIKNRFNNLITTYDSNNYILLKIYTNNNKNITLNEIDYLTNTIYKENIFSNWGLLWSKKIDYLEDLISENGKKYPLIVESFNYYVGLAENAISYYNSINLDNNLKHVISHKNLNFNSTIEDLYNPLNIIFDYKVRDVAEYIKNSFFINKDISKELTNYLNKNPLSLNEVKLLISRILYPSFYFNLYEDIILEKKEEKILLDLISKTNEYEKYLNNIISFFHKYYSIDEIEWLKKK